MALKIMGIYLPVSSTYFKIIWRKQLELKPTLKYSKYAKNIHFLSAIFRGLHKTVDGKAKDIEFSNVYFFLFQSK